MDAENRKEIDALKNQIGTLKVLYLVVVILFVSSIINFQIQYSNIRSFYQASLNDYQNLNLLLAEQNLELEDICTCLEEMVSPE